MQVTISAGPHEYGGVKSLEIITPADVIGWTAPQVFVAALCALVGLALRSLILRTRLLEMRRAREIRTP